MSAFPLKADIRPRGSVCNNQLVSVLGQKLP